MFWARSCVTLVTTAVATLAAAASTGSTASTASTGSTGSRIGPYHLEIRGVNNQSIYGNAGACHAGAAIEGLCYEAGAAPNDNYYNFYYSYGSFDPTTGVAQQPGWISWFLQIGSNESASLIESAMRLEGSWGSNVAPALFYPDTERGAHLYFAPETGELYATGPDDCYATVEAPAHGLPQRNYTNFHLCYQYTGGYWYHSIAWVYALPPSNPTCEPVSLKLTGGF